MCFTWGSRACMSMQNAYLTVLIVTKNILLMIYEFIQIHMMKKPRVGEKCQVEMPNTFGNWLRSCSEWISSCNFAFSMSQNHN